MDMDMTALLEGPTHTNGPEQGDMNTFFLGLVMFFLGVAGAARHGRARWMDGRDGDRLRGYWHRSLLLITSFFVLGFCSGFGICFEALFCVCFFYLLRLFTRRESGVGWDGYIGGW